MKRANSRRANTESCSVLMYVISKQQNKRMKGSLKTSPAPTTIVLFTIHIKGKISKTTYCPVKETERCRMAH